MTLQLQTAPALRSFVSLRERGFHMLRATASNRLVQLLLILLVNGTLLCHAQVGPTQATLRGRVLDPNRALVAGAKIIAEAKGRAASFSAVTDERGEFSLTLAPG